MPRMADGTLVPPGDLGDHLVEYLNNRLASPPDMDSDPDYRPASELDTVLTYAEKDLQNAGGALGYSHALIADLRSHLPRQMTRETLDRWLDELRSGGRQQTQHVLYSSGIGGYCCLGVLAYCTQQPDNLVQGIAISADEVLDEQLLLPGAWGLTERQQHYLAHLNDQGFTFEHIADAIDFMFSDFVDGNRLKPRTVASVTRWLLGRDPDPKPGPEPEPKSEPV